MKKSSLRIPFVAAWLALLACACPSAAPVPGSADETKSRAVVTLTCGLAPCTYKVTPVLATDGKCTLTTDPEAYIVTHHQAVFIEWQFADGVPERFRFQRLHFKDEDPAYLKINKHRIRTPSKDQFYDKRVKAQSASVYDKNTVNGVWDYALVVTDGTVTCKLDPPIINDY